MFLPSEDILKNLSEIIHPYAFVFAVTLTLKNSLTCMSATSQDGYVEKLFSVRNFVMQCCIIYQNVHKNVCYVKTDGGRPHD